jgi:hypothetical protein
LKDAEVYFTNLWVDAKCPDDIRAQAIFAYGDTLMSMDDPNETNKVARYRQAITAFDWVGQKFPNSTQAVLALGEKAICLLQWEQNTHSYEQASNAFSQVIASPLADSTARSIAKVGLGVVMEKEAEMKTGTERTDLLKKALDQYLDVFLGAKEALKSGEKPNLFWTEKAGLEAARLATSPGMQRWSIALGIYQTLLEWLPPLRPRLEKNILKVQEQLNLEKD